MIEGVPALVFGSIFMLFLPGFALSWLFFPQKSEIDWVERIALSFGLSIAVVPLAVFCLNLLFGARIDFQNIAIIVAAITIIAYLGYVERTKKSLSKHARRKSSLEPATPEHEMREETSSKLHSRA